MSVVSALGRGAAEGAPTAPHATPRPRKSRAKKSGPERFWDRKRLRVAFGTMLFASFLVHLFFAPWSFAPPPFEVRDVEGETAIPVDLLEPEKEPEPEPPPVQQQVADNPAEKDPAGVGAGDAAAVKAGVDASDGGAGPIPDAEPDVHDAGPDVTDAAPRDPVAMAGDVGQAQAGEALVVLLVNAAEIKKHPIGSQMGPLLSSIPQWDDFIAGTGVDPINQTDWVLISGPGLVDTSNDVIIVRYSAPDAVVDKAIDVVAKKYDRGGPFDAGVPGVRAALGHADRAPRVFLRPQSHLLAVVPVHYANTAAKILVRSKVSPNVRPGEAMRLTLKRPYQPFPQIPKTVSELRLWVLPHADGSAEVLAEGDCATDADAKEAADAINKVVMSYRTNFWVATFTKGLLNSLDVKSSGKLVTLHLDASQDQIEAILSLVEGQVRAMKSPKPAPPPSGSAPAPAPSSSAKKP